MHSKLLFACLLTSVLSGQYVANPAYSVRPLIGSGGRGDGGPAIQAIIDGPYGLAQDSAGNIYISESNAGAIRRVLPDGTIQHFSGTADDPVVPTQITVAPDGALIYYDSLNCRLRRVGGDGGVRDIAGTGSCTASGGGGSSGRELPALQTLITSVGGITYDSAGRLVYSEPSKNVLRRIDADGYIRIIAGTGATGYSGDEADATYALLNGPAGLTIDTSGNIYIADAYNCRVRRLDTDGVIHAVLGTTFCARANATYVGGSNAALERVDSIAWDGSTNSLLISMPRVYRIVRYDLNALRLAPFIGSGAAGTTTNSDPLKMPVNSPTAVLPSAYGILIADNTSYQVYRSQNGAMQTFVGHWPQVDVYNSALEAQILTAEGTLPLPDGSLLLADSGANRIVQWQAPDALATIAGIINPTGAITGDNGPAVNASVSSPRRFALRQNGEIFFTEPTRIRAITPAGLIRTVRSNLNGLAGLVFDSSDRVIYSEAGSQRVVRLDLSTNKITILAGVTNVAAFYGDGAAATSAFLNSPGDLAWDKNGNLLIADRGNQRVRLYTFADGFINTVVGNGLPFSYNNVTGQAAINTGFGNINGLVTDPQGNMYLGESQRVTKVDTSGKISIVTGFVSEDDSGNINWMDGVLNGVGALSLDNAGNLYISLRDTGRVLVVGPPRSDVASKRPDRTGR